jgi:tartrate dehydrogenase/decarboxylase/D-malate dehydrogenase
MTTLRIALYPGDGIGPEVLEQALRVLDAVAQRASFAVQTTRFEWGAEYHARHGIVAPRDYLDTLRPL